MHILVRRIGLAVCAALLIGCGASGIVATRAHFAVCDRRPLTDACYDAMDGAGSFYGTMPALWVVSLVAAMAALVLVRGRVASGLGWIAVAIVIVFNVVVEYAVWVALSGGRTDVPPGAGLSMSVAFIVAGALVGVAARVTADRTSPGVERRAVSAGTG